METVVTAIISALVSLGAVWLANWSQRGKLKAEQEKIRADAVKTYQEIAVKEAQERRESEARFEERITQLETDKHNLERSVRKLAGELKPLKEEKKQWLTERADLKNRVKELESQIVRDQGEIIQLHKEIKKLKVSTGNLGGE